jgi:hypothetical protein
VRLLKVEHDVKLALRTARACGDGEGREVRGERCKERGTASEAAACMRASYSLLLTLTTNYLRLTACMRDTYGGGGGER